MRRMNDGYFGWTAVPVAAALSAGAWPASLGDLVRPVEVRAYPLPRFKFKSVGAAVAFLRRRLAEERRLLRAKRARGAWGTPDDTAAAYLDHCEGILPPE